MSRVALTGQEQASLLRAVQRRLKASQGQLATWCEAHPRTFSDWLRGEYRMRYESLQRLVERTGIALDKPVGNLPDFSHVRAAARLGGLRKYQLYGNPGTPEGRRKGGLASIARRLAAGPLAVSDGFRMAKIIREPGLSSELAEFMGIMLGNGCLNSRYQAAIYFNTETDLAYATFVEEFANRLFGIMPHRGAAEGAHAGELMFSSTRLVDCLLRLGMARGDKVVNQAAVPSWILTRKEFRRSCLRGLVDTDGSVYAYEHTVYDRRYRHVAWCFTNRSSPILRFVEETLRLNGYHPMASPFHVYLHRQREIARYFSDIGTHNAKHLQRYQHGISGLERLKGRGTQVDDGDRLESD